jgi:hypothetical protein
MIMPRSLSPLTNEPALRLVHRPGHTPDEEIDVILAERRRKGTWPVKHSTVNYFSVQRDLVKIRFHHSEKYQHIPVRIPKTEKNKGK